MKERYIVYLTRSQGDDSDISRELIGDSHIWICAGQVESDASSGLFEDLLVKGEELRKQAYAASRAGLHCALADLAREQSAGLLKPVEAIEFVLVYRDDVWQVVGPRDCFGPLTDFLALVQ